MKVLRGILYAFSTLFIYLGVPVLGWGLDDLRGFFALPSRLAFALVILLFGIAVGIQAVNAPEGIRGGSGESGKRIPRQHIVRVVMVTALYAALFFLPFADRRALGVLPDQPPARWIGLFLGAIGCGLIFWSGLALGRFYSQEVTLQKDHRLVTSGPYHVVRHPRYLGILALSLGLSLLFRSWAGLILSVLFFSVLLLRIRDEEALLHKEFGAAWESYCKQSWRLIPYLY